MTDDHGHGYPCGHNHDPNPYTDPKRSAAYGNVLRNLFRLTIITSSLDPRLATMNAACTVIGLAKTDDAIPTVRAMLWELGSLVNVLTGSKEPQLEVHKCDHDDEPGHEPDDHDEDTHFGTQAMKAFFAAAAVGNLQNAVNVLDAVTAEADANDMDRDACVAQFFGNALVSAAFTARVTWTGAEDLFKD